MDSFNLDKLMQNAINSQGTHYDVAMIIYFFYKDTFKIFEDKWYKANDSVYPPKWEECVNGYNEMYINISRKIFDVFMEKHDQLYQCSVTAETLELTDKFKEIARSVKKIANNCKTVNYKNSLMKECKPLFTVYSL